MSLTEEEVLHAKLDAALAEIDALTTTIKQERTARQQAEAALRGAVELEARKWEATIQDAIGRPLPASEGATPDDWLRDLHVEVAADLTAREQAEAHVARLWEALVEVRRRADCGRVVDAIALAAAALAATPAESAAELAALRTVAEAARLCTKARRTGGAALAHNALCDALAALDAAKEGR